LYRLAADQGHANPQYNLGVCYYNGTGVDVDHTEAVRLFRLAARLPARVLRLHSRPSPNSDSNGALLAYHPREVEANEGCVGVGVEALVERDDQFTLTSIFQRLYVHGASY
jgi:TPR repeat protein